jgi:Ax21 family sulfation-dependent quorum factor
MKKSALLLALALASPFAAPAAELSYTYLEAGYLRVDPDNVGSENGFAIRGSGALNENFHVFGAYENVDVSSIDIDSWRLGLGYNYNMGGSTDLYARFAYEKIDVEFFDDNGWSAEVGVRGALSDNFEGYAGLRYTKFDDDDTSGVIGGQYKFNPTWGLAADLSFNGDGNALFIGPRVSF